MFVVIINILENENTVTLAIFTKSSYDRWWNHNYFGHDLTSIGLVYPLFINESPQFGWPHSLCKNIWNPSNIPFFLILLPPPICNWDGVSNYVFAPLQNTEYLDLEGFFDTDLDRTGH